jgi:hypothetical protein
VANSSRSFSINIEALSQSLKTGITAEILIVLMKHLSTGFVLRIFQKNLMSEVFTIQIITSFITFVPYCQCS